MDFSWVDGYILDVISRYRYPSIALGIVSGDEVYLRGYGFRDLTRMLPADEYTLYGVGSITKSFTALAILQLYKKGLIDIYSRVDKYIDNPPKVFKEYNITIHNLLTHSSGVPALAYAEAYIRGALQLSEEWLPIIESEDIFSFMDKAHEWVSAEPGTKFYYLNEGYVILGHIISRLTGMTYEEYIYNNILDKLKMDRSYFERDMVEADGNWAKPYILDKEKNFVESGFPFGITSDGGLISNVVDMIKYIKMYLNRGSLDGVEVIDREYIELMEKPHIKMPYEVLGGESYGYGLMITPDFYGYKLVGHGGSVLVHTAYTGYIPEKKLGIILLSNISSFRLSYIAFYLLAKLLDRDPSQLPFIKGEYILEKLKGAYHTYKNTMKAYVDKNGSILTITFKDKYREDIIPLLPIKIDDDKAVFKANVSWREYLIEFNIREDYIDFHFERYRFIKELDKSGHLSGI